MPSKSERGPRRHQEIADELRAKILSGELAPGSKIEGENGLMERHAAARSTVRQALDALRAEGLIESRQGVGVTVRAFRPIRRPAVQRLSSEVWHAGRSIWDVDLEDRPRRVEVDVNEDVDAPDYVVQLLGSDESMCCRSRRFYVEERLIQTAVSYVPMSLAAGTAITQADTGPGGMYARLAEIGHAPARFKEEVRARMPTPQEAAEFGLSPGTPVFQIMRIAADQNDRLVEVNEMTLDGSNYILEYVFSS
ncbi:GntR family transcriptional regulator [Streptomyces sp. NPDC087422]|uniref:GntR family transcriptional regulator n=1 Tax=Streptomyces sp. NPDC087422 TaxID=3365786 RepID=UPI0037F1A724